MNSLLFPALIVIITFVGAQCRCSKQNAYEDVNVVFGKLELMQDDFDDLIKVINLESLVYTETEKWNFFTDLKDKIVSKFESAKEAMAHLKNELKEGFEENIKGIDNWLTAVHEKIVVDLHKTSHAIHELEGEISAAISKGSKETAEQLKKLKGKLSGKLTSAKIHIMEMINTVEENICESNAAVKQKFIEIKEKIVSGLKKTKEEMLIVGGKIKHEMSSVSDWFKTRFTKEKFLEFLSKIKAVVQKVYNMIPEEVKEEAAKSFEEMVSEIKQSIINEGKEVAQNAVDMLEKTLSDEIDKAVDRLQDLISGHDVENI